MTPARFEAVVVGSGPNGLAAAITLAQAGLKVGVYEAADQFGGSARTTELCESGFLNDVCASVVPMALASPFFRSLPLQELGLEYVQPDIPLAHPFVDGSAVFIHRDLAQTAMELGRDERAWTRLFGPLAQQFEDLVSDALKPLGLPKHPLLLSRLGLSAIRSAQAVAARFREDKTRALFAGLAAHSVFPLERSPSAGIGVMLGAAAHAVGWPLVRGGIGQLSGALAKHLCALGGEILTRHPVTSLNAIETDGPILFELAPAGLLDIAGDALQPSEQKALQRFCHGPGVCKVDWTLETPIPWKNVDVGRAGTVHLGGTFEEIAASERAVAAGKRAEAPYVLLVQQSLFDATRAPSGKHVAWAYCHMPAGSDVDESALIEAQVERVAPGFSATIRKRHVRTAAGYQAYNPSYVGGDINGGASSLGQLFFRPRLQRDPYRTTHPRLYLCSASTPPGGGVHGMAGHYAALSALRHL